MVFQFEWQGAQLQNLRRLVCTRKCLDEPNEQLRSYSPPADPVPVLNPRPDLSVMTGSHPIYETDVNGEIILDHLGNPISLVRP
ncbi:MAG TPA: hypothetical protein VH024_17500 [Candidatus Angelobacter sp.]|nr:hypothetical protein [Candidatus Angelobacter sp.]